MLVIRDAQMKVFERQAFQRFEDFMWDWVQRHHSGLARNVGEGEMRCQIRLGVARAEEHGLELTHDLARYLALRFQHGPEFDAPEPEGLPGARALLEDPRRSPSVRIHLLYETFG